MKFKSGFVAIIGKPNAGKSTLMNSMLGQKLSITTSKAQTTRKRVLGILDEDDYQIIFLDTPGILNPDYLLQEKMLQYVTLSVRDADVILILLDLQSDRYGKAIIDDAIVKEVLKKENAKKILVINKIDLTNEDDLKRLIEKFSSENMFDQVIPVSALETFNVASLLAAVQEYLPEGPRYFPEGQISDENERFFVSEIIREKIFEKYSDEIPYSIEVAIEEFTERENRKDFISASIIAERDSQKAIIIGKKGEAIKRVGQMAREAIEEFLEREVYLELRVKVKSKWRNNPNMLKNYGYDLGNDK